MVNIFYFGLNVFGIALLVLELNNLKMRLHNPGRPNELDGDLMRNKIVTILASTWHKSLKKCNVT